MTRLPPFASPVCCRAAVLATALAWGAAAAAPVEGSDDAAPAGPYELAMQWTLAGVPTRTGLMPDMVLEPLPLPLATPPLLLPSSGDPVPEPSAYALVGLALFGIGLWARRRGSSQRGASKKT